MSLFQGFAFGKSGDVDAFLDSVAQNGAPFRAEEVRGPLSTNDGDKHSAAAHEPFGAAALRNGDIDDQAPLVPAVTGPLAAKAAPNSEMSPPFARLLGASVHDGATTEHEKASARKRPRQGDSEEDGKPKPKKKPTAKPRGLLLSPRAKDAAEWTPLPRAFFERSDCAAVARELLGKALCTRVDGEVTKAIVVETEAYTGLNDRACHAARFGRTARTASMYLSAGHVYVFAVHASFLFNVVIGDEDLPAAVLVRAVEPLHNVDIMIRRRKLVKVRSANLSSGPGMLTNALAIDKSMDAMDLCMEDPGHDDVTRVWMEDVGIDIPEEGVLRSPRVNVDYAGDDKHHLYRFRVQDSPHTSRA